jgi:methionyl-tRNA formyltransferase
MDNVSIILYPSVRALMYLNVLETLELKPRSIILMGGEQAIDNVLLNPYLKNHSNYINVKKDKKYFEYHLGMTFDIIETLDINHNEIFEKLSSSDSSYVIFSGGGILQKRFFELKKKIIHTHPGKLPDTRGSTCFYYDILKTNKTWATSFIMEESLDEGDLLAIEEFETPKISDYEKYFFDLIWDPWIRAQTLRKALVNFKRNQILNGVPQNKNIGTMYYVIHPILKNLAIRKKIF